MQYHVFISYARKDNEPRRADGRGWVHLFKRRLEAQYLVATGRALRVYLDEERIENGDHWETSIKDALRQSRILIAVLSPNYLASSICRMELEEYIRHEQTATPGGEGVRPIYFATVPELEGKVMTEGDQDRLIADLKRRNRDAGLNWCAWAEQAVAALLQVEAEDRLADLKANPEPPLDRFVAGISTLQKKISERLNDVALGELALQSYEAALETLRQLATDNPESAEARRDLSISQHNIGDFYLRRGGPGDAELALQAYEAALETVRQLAADNPESAQARRDVWVSLVNLGQLALQAKQIDVATKHLAEALDIVESFAAEGRMMDPEMRSARSALREGFGLPPVEGEA